MNTELIKKAKDLLKIARLEARKDAKADRVEARKEARKKEARLKAIQAKSPSNQEAKA